MTEPDHPFLLVVAAGARLGWEHTFVHEVGSPARAIADDGGRAARRDLRDGYRAAEVCDAIVRSAETGRREAIPYRS